MKKFSVIMAVILFLMSACSSSGDISTVLLAAEKIEKYDEAVAQLLSDCKWNYDKTSLTYEISDNISFSDERYNEILEASKYAGLDFSKYKNSVYVAASASLLHFNGDNAGKAYFYIVNEEIVCAYYIYNLKIYSLTDKNVFLRSGVFDNKEDTEREVSFTQMPIEFPYDDYNDISSSGSIAVIDDSNVLKICQVSDNCRVIKTVNLSGGFYPMDFKFTQNGGIVLAGKLEDEYLNGSTGVDYEEEYADTAEESYKFKSWKLVFLDSRFRETNREFPLDVSTYTAVNVLHDKIFLTRANTIDIFENTGNGYEKSGQISLKHDIDKLKFADIDNSGKTEAVITDGMDIYIYTYEDDSFKLLWKSYLSIPSMTDSLYIADLNNDGVSEIYIEDLSETTARYILGEKSFHTYSNGIEYGNKFIPGDFNNDGYVDYIKINMQTQDTVLEISEGAEE